MRCRQERATIGYGDVRSNFCAGFLPGGNGSDSPLLASNTVSFSCPFSPQGFLRTLLRHAYFAGCHAVVICAYFLLCAVLRLAVPANQTFARHGFLPTLHAEAACSPMNSSAAALCRQPAYRFMPMRESMLADMGAGAGCPCPLQHIAGMQKTACGSQLLFRKLAQSISRLPSGAQGEGCVQNRLERLKPVSRVRMWHSYP